MLHLVREWSDSRIRWKDKVLSDRTPQGLPANATDTLAALFLLPQGPAAVFRHRVAWHGGVGQGLGFLSGFPAGPEP